MNHHSMDHSVMDGQPMAPMNHANMGQAHPHSAAPDESKSLPPTLGVHNQMMVGEQTIYLSHLPMFMFDPQDHPHNFQVILEVTLHGPGNPQSVYTNERRNNPGERMYTMSPDAFEMVALDPRQPGRPDLTGTIFRGHLERGGEQIIERAVAQVVNTVYFHEFDPNAQPPAQLEYLLFGKTPDLFLAHVITRPPDFDQILSVEVHPDFEQILSMLDQENDLSQGIRIQFFNRENTPHQRIKAGERIAGFTVQPNNTAGRQAGQRVELQIDAVTEFYFEEGELRLPMTMKQTTEERTAGF